MNRTATVKVAPGANKRCFDHAIKTVRSMDGRYDPYNKVWAVVIDDDFDMGVINDPEYYSLVVLFDSAKIETIIEQIENPTTTEDTDEMTETTVTAEMIANGTAPKLTYHTYPELRDGETVTVRTRAEERHSLSEFRALYPALCCDENGNDLPDCAITPVFPASTFITDTTSPKLKQFWAEQEG